jgi:ATP-dependent Clp protease ATP-binding subunit ClpA
MPERFTGDARQVVVCASGQARRLGHGFIGGEHLLYGLASADGQVGAVLRERGVTPERVEAEFVRLIGPENTAGRSLFDTLNGVPHRILSVIGASAPRLGAEIRDRCR